MRKTPPASSRPEPCVWILVLGGSHVGWLAGIPLQAHGHTLADTFPGYILDDKCKYTKNTSRGYTKNTHKTYSVQLTSHRVYTPDVPLAPHTACKHKQHKGGKRHAQRRTETGRNLLYSCTRLGHSDEHPTPSLTHTRTRRRHGTDLLRRGVCICAAA